MQNPVLKILCYERLQTALKRVRFVTSEWWVGLCGRMTGIELTEGLTRSSSQTRSPSVRWWWHRHTSAVRWCLQFQPSRGTSRKWVYSPPLETAAVLGPLRPIRSPWHPREKYQEVVFRNGYFLHVNATVFIPPTPCHPPTLLPRTVFNYPRKTRVCEHLILYIRHIFSIAKFVC